MNIVELISTVRMFGSVWLMRDEIVFLFCAFQICAGFLCAASPNNIINKGSESMLDGYCPRSLPSLLLPLLLLLRKH